MGNATVDEIYEMYKEMVIIGLDAGVDLFHCACGGFGEAEIAMKVIKNNSKLPILATLSFNPTPKGFRTMEGIDPATGARKLEELGADVIGTQCGGIGYEEVTAVLREMGKACSKYLMAKPNSGIPQLINGKTVWPATPEEMAKAALNWVSAGARIISGCCGTTPEHIAKVVAVVK